MHGFLNGSVGSNRMESSILFTSPIWIFPRPNLGDHRRPIAPEKVAGQDRTRHDTDTGATKMRFD